MKSKLNASNRKVNREENDFIHDLQIRNESLQQEQKRLQGQLKNASQTVKRLKKEVQALKRRRNHAIGGMSVHRPTRAASHNSLSLSTTQTRRSGTFDSARGCRTSCGGGDDEMRDDSGATHVLGQMQQRLIAADNEIQRLKAENDRLVGAISHVDANTSRASCGATFDFLGETNDFVNDKKIVSFHEANGSSADIVEQLQEAKSSFRVLEVQYNSLETTSQVQLQVHKQTRLKLDDCNAYIKKLKREAEELNGAYEAANQKAFVGEQYKDQLEELFEENRGLEGKLSELCDLPFIRDEPVEDAGRSDHIQELENEVDHYKHQADVLSKDIMSFETSAISMQEENRDLELNCSELQELIRQLQDEIDASAHQVTSLRHAANQTSPSPDHVTVYHSDGIGAKEPVVVAETDTIAKGGSINHFIDGEQCREGLHQAAKLDKLHGICMQRLQRIRILEEELDTKMSSVISQQPDKSSNDGSQDLENLDIASDENVLHLSIVKCTLDSRIIGGDAQTIAVMNVLNFESQASGFGTGSKPCYGLSASYKMKHCRFLVEEIMRRCARFEIYRLEEDASHHFLGSSMFQLKYLLNSSSGKHEYNLEIISSDSNTTIGDMLVSASLVRPLQALKRFRMDECATENFQTDSIWAGDNLKSPQLNELEVVLELKDVAATGTQIFIGYSFLGIFTEISYKNDLDQGFQDTKVFPIEMSSGFIAAMEEACIELCLSSSSGCHDRDQSSIEGEASTYMMGTGVATFGELTRDQDISKSVELISSQGTTIGRIEVKMKWLQKLHLNVETNECLNGETELLGYFMKEHKVDYILFLRFVDPPRQMYEHILQLRKHEAYLRQNLRLQGDVLCEQNFVKVIESLAERSIKRDEATDMFNYISSGDINEINANFFFHFFFSRQLQYIRTKLLSQKSTNSAARIARNLFKKSDTDAHGYVSEKVFLDILETLGVLF